jgi:hypothetical protein
VEPLVLSRWIDPEKPEQPVGSAVEDGDRAGHDPGESHQRQCHPAADYLGIEQGDGLRHQLAQNDMEDGDDDERDDRCDGVRRDCGDRGRQPGEAIGDQTRERRLADPAQPQRGQGDAQLGGGDVAVERLYRTARQPSFAVSRTRHLVQPGPPRSYQGEFGRDEKGVREDENDDG